VKAVQHAGNDAFEQLLRRLSHTELLECLARFERRRLVILPEQLGTQTIEIHLSAGLPAGLFEHDRPALLRLGALCEKPCVVQAQPAKFVVAGQRIDRRFGVRAEESAQVIASTPSASRRVHPARPAIPPFGRSAPMPVSRVPPTPHCASSQRTDCASSPSGALPARRISAAQA
jgi:hypothetical protein